MQDIKEILMRIGEAKTKRREIRKQIGEVFAQSKTYCENQETLVQLRAKKQQLEAEMMQTMPTEQDQLEKLTASIDDDTQMLSDMALTMLMKGESIAIEGEEVRWEPRIKVRFERQLKLF